FPALLGVLLAAGCAHPPYQPAPGDDSALQRWVETGLVPYLAQQLGEHPRFRSETVLLVRLDGQDIQPEIDGLTRRIRDRIRDGLLATPGIHLPWQPQQPPAEHHRRLDQVECGRIRDADYFIGIEITRMATARYRVSVRALDVRAAEWVSGFGHSWSGALTPDELRALQERRSDESLRGLRVLPFDSGQPDLAATYLANNLSCLLRQQDTEEPVIHVVEPMEAEQPRLRTLLGLIGNNLSRFREVRVTDSAAEANFLLRGEAHAVQPGLYQVWVVLHPAHSGEHLAGMDTAAYLRIRPAAGGLAGGEPAVTRMAEKPSITGMELVRRRNHDGAPVVELAVAAADQVYVFVHGTRDGITRLSPGSCRHGSEPAYAGTLRRWYRYPESRLSSAEWPTVYAIAVAGPELERQFSALLRILPDACDSDNGLRAGDAETERWLGRLDQLLAANGERAVWTARRIP
ncbi:MAG: hypothetical protein PVI50_07720, partial [Gammaproteobacteria bacterium]